MCYTSFQKYTRCRTFRQHYIYKDIQCEEMKMWSKLFKREVWCRRSREHGTASIIDDENRIALGHGAHYPPPPPEIEVPERTVCWRCNKSPLARGSSNRRPAKRSTLAVGKRSDLTMTATKTFGLLAHALPKDFAYRMLRLCAGGKLAEETLGKS